MNKTRHNVLRFGTAIGSTLTALVCIIFAANTQTASHDIQNGLPSEALYADMPALDFAARNLDLQRADEAPQPLQQLSKIIAEGRATEDQGADELNNVLSSADAALYRQAFAATHKKQYAQASKILSQIGDQSLAGHILAERYLKEESKPSYTALTAWLKEYADYPQATRIYSKAVQLQPTGSPAPSQPATQAVVRGNLAETGTELETTINLSETDPGIALEDRQLGAQINSLLRQGKGVEAEQAFNLAKTQRIVHPTLDQQARALIAAAMFFDGDETRVQALPEQVVTSSPLAAWTSGLHAWRMKSYRVAARYFALFATNKKLNSNERAAGYYWQARALHKFGANDKARAALHSAAEAPRSFYGMLARAQIGENLAPIWAMPQLTAAHLELIGSTAAGRRGIALLQINEPALAVAEFQRIKVQGDRPRATALMALAHAAKLPALALTLGSHMKTEEGGLFDGALYPIPPWQPVVETGADRAIIYAVMRQESGFNPAAISHCGARGLMQLMPRTANYMTPADLRTMDANLFDPSINMTLGMRYIQYLSRQPDIAYGLLPLLAAYNGGPGNAARWIKASTHGDDPLLFIETLPVRETRNYLERVLSGYWIYQARLGQPQDSLHALVNGQWPSLSPRIQDVRLTSAPSSVDQNLIKIASR